MVMSVMLALQCLKRERGLRCGADRWKWGSELGGSTHGVDAGQ